MSRFTLALAAAAFILMPFAAEAAPEVGKLAPAFTATDSAGKTQSLAAYKGKIVVLEWSNPECPFVKKHYGSGNMQALQKRAADEGVVWLTVNSSAARKQGNLTAAEANTVLAAQKAAPTAYILDPEGRLGRLYGASATPHMFVIDKDGALAYAGAIDDKPSTSAADIAGAKNYVRAALDALAADEVVEPTQTKAYGCGVKYKD